MLQPKRTKFRKRQKGRVKGMAQRGHRIAFGAFALKALEPGWITSRQIEAARIAMTREMKREGQVWIRIFPDKPVTKKPAEVRMGKGKGAHFKWICPIKIGQILVEFRFRKKFFSFLEILLLLRKCKKKLPIKCQIVSKSSKLLKNNLEKNFNKIF